MITTTIQVQCRNCINGGKLDSDMEYSGSEGVQTLPNSGELSDRHDYDCPSCGAHIAIIITTQLPV